VEANRARYRRNFELAQEILGPLFGEIRPAGGFFLWLEVGDGEQAAIELWRQAAIKVLPGGYMARPDASGRNPAAGYIRVALIQDPEETAGALRRMAKVLDPMMQQSMKRAAGR
jgi:N-succinyldiaminopimelate aminotransferase